MGKSAVDTRRGGYLRPDGRCIPPGPGGFMRPCLTQAASLAVKSIAMAQTSDFSRSPNSGDVLRKDRVCAASHHPIPAPPEPPPPQALRRPPLRPVLGAPGEPPRLGPAMASPTPLSLAAHCISVFDCKRRGFWQLRFGPNKWLRCTGSARLAGWLTSWHKRSMAQFFF